jgi:tetratricopeptide (TPR) repeat protein
MTRHLACCLLCLAPSLAYGVGDHFKRGKEALDKKDFDKAIASFTAAIRDNPKDAHAYFFRGEAHFEKKDYRRAVKDYTEAIRLDPKHAPYYYVRGVVFADEEVQRRADQEVQRS